MNNLNRTVCSHNKDLNPQKGRDKETNEKVCWDVRDKIPSSYSILLFPWTTRLGSSIPFKADLKKISNMIELSILTNRNIHKASELDSNNMPNDDQYSIRRLVSKYA